MGIVITEINAQNLLNANKCHEPFLVDAKLLLSANNGILRYAVAGVSPYQKRYPPNEIDYVEYIGCPDQTVYFAHVDEELAGELVLRRWWNDYAYIEDLAVKTAFRRRGVGRALIRSATEWARIRRLPGLMLETQNNNVPACLFYESCGFELGGFDRLLYSALHRDTEEVALYWYLPFE